MVVISTVKLYHLVFILHQGILARLRRHAINQMTFCHNSFYKFKNNQVDTSKRKFIIYTIASVTGSIFLPKILYSKLMDDKKALSADLVKNFVIAGHGDLPKVKEMLTAEPGLLNASWDWKEGDFETAIGGAGHIGSKEIASYLIAQGARIDIFVAAMLGKLELVKVFTDAFPEMIYSKGPHGLSLMHHAKKGGDDSLNIVEFLNSKGINE